MTLGLKNIRKSQSHFTVSPNMNSSNYSQLHSKFHTMHLHNFSIKFFFFFLGWQGSKNNFKKKVPINQKIRTLIWQQCLSMGNQFQVSTSIWIWTSTQLTPPKDWNQTIWNCKKNLIKSIQLVFKKTKFILSRFRKSQRQINKLKTMYYRTKSFISILNHLLCT